jgi:hypothetical protein
MSNDNAVHEDQTTQALYENRPTNHKEPTQPQTENIARSLPAGDDEPSQMDCTPITKKQWKRTDRLAVWAIIISITSVMATSMATYVTYESDKRTQLSDMEGAMAVIADMGSKIQLLAQDADLSAMFIEAFLDGEKQYPESKNKVAWLEFDFIRRMKLLDLKLSTEKLTLLSHGNSDVAITSAACASYRDELQADMDSLATTKPGDWEPEQITTVQLLPYRLHKLSALCNQAEKSFVALMPASQSNEPLRGTIGELMAAQQEEALRARAGLTAKLEIAPKSGKKKVRIHEKFVLATHN